MNDLEAIAQKFDKLDEQSPVDYASVATSIREAHAQATRVAMFGLSILKNDSTVTPEEQRDIADFAFNQRSYR